MRAPACSALAALALGGAAAAFAYPDDPPLAHTGGFGEPTCAKCHTGAGPDDPAGSLRLEGVPESYAPGGRYRIGVVLRREGMQAGGFQLAARCGDGRQAGALASADSARVEVTGDAKSGVHYAHQTAEGTVPAPPGSIAWELEWTAPSAGCGAVRFDAAANAANGDASALGDHVYTRSRRAELGAGR